MNDKKVQTIEIPSDVTLHLSVTGGNLVVQGNGEAQATLTCLGEVAIEQEDERFEIRSDGELIASLPRALTLRIDEASEDVIIQDMEGPISIGATGDDVVLKNISNEVSLEHCAGDVVAERVTTLRISGEVEGDVTLRAVGEFEGRLIQEDLSATEVGRVQVSQVGRASVARVGEVRIDMSEGDVALSQVGGETVTLGTIAGDLHVSHTGGNLVVENVEGDAALHAIGQNVTVSKVEGDLSASQVGMELNVARVEGDANVTQVGTNVRLGKVEGALHVNQVGVELVVEEVEGDASINDVAVNISLGEVEGDLSVGNLGRSLSVRQVEGDVSLSGTAAPGAEITLSAEGDVSVGLRGAARYEVRAQGRVHAPRLMRVETNEEGFFVGHFGNSESPASVSIQAEGDVSLGEQHWHGHGHGHGPDVDELAREIEQQVRESMRGVERNIERNIRQTMREVDRHVSRAMGEAAREMARHGISIRPPRAPQPPHAPEEPWAGMPPRFGPPPPPMPGHSRGSWRGAFNEWLQQFREMEARPEAPARNEDLHEETMAVLRMVQEGVISAEEAEKLLEAMRPQRT